VAQEINAQIVFTDPMADDCMGNMIEVAHKFKAGLK
jgi:hypothetical protein